MLINNFQRNSCLKRRVYPYILLSPFFLTAFVFQLLPIIFTFIISFFSWNGLEQMSFVALENYNRMLFKDSRFAVTLFNTGILLLMTLPVSICVALFTAQLMNSKNMLFKRFFQLTNFLPYLALPVAVGLIWSILFDWKYGTVNSILTNFGLLDKPVNWLGIPTFARFVLSLIVIWKSFGYLSILFLAGISAIPDELYEASTVDGADPIQKFFKVTLPLLKPVLTFVIITGIIGGLQMFDEPFLLFKGGPTGAQPFGGPKLSCLTMMMNFYDTAFRSFNLSYGAAIAYGIFFVVCILSFSSLKILTRGED